MAYIGAIVTQSPRPESAQEVCDQLVPAANHIDKQRLGSTDDCGFSPLSIDMKPNHVLQTMPGMSRFRKSPIALPEPKWQPRN
jgi:hypothetical protein